MPRQKNTNAQKTYRYRRADRTYRPYRYYKKNLKYGPNWDTQRNQARKRDKYTCQICHVTERQLGRSLHVHHITPLKHFHYVPGKNENYRQANHLSNLRCLCPTCHARLEFRLRHQYRFR